MLVAVATLILAALAADARAAEKQGFHFVDGDGWRELRFGEQPVYRLMTKYDPADRENTYKPFHHVYGFHGEGPITKGPGGSFPHHRGIFFGYNKTPHGDFWHCKDGVSQRHVEFLADREQVSTDSARTASVTDWVAQDGKAVVRDTRQVTARRGAAGDELVLDFEVTLEGQPGTGEMKLDGDPHHAGFHFRAAQEVTGESPDKKQTTGGLATFILPAGAAEEKNAIVTGADWIGCKFAVQGNPYLVVHMDHPSNPRPVRYSTRPYGRFGSFAPVTLKEGEPLTFRYRVLVIDGKAQADVTREQLAQRFADYSAGK